MACIKRISHAAALICLLFALTAAAQTQADAHAILVLGDSLSAGYGIDVDQGWVKRLQRRLEQTDYSVPVINASISGETTAGALGRLPALLKAHRPSVVVIELGGNDGLRGLSLQTMKHNLHRMVALSQAQGARVLLLGIKIPPNYGAAYTQRFWQVYRDLAKSMNIAWVAFFMRGVALHPRLMQADGIHPDAAAQPILLDNVWPALEPLLRDKQKQ